MNTLLAVLTLVLSAQAFSAANVFCKDNKKIISILSEDAYECQAKLYSGEVCFTGPVAEAAKVLNSKGVASLFDGTDGEYIKGARVSGPNSIKYKSVDDANDAFFDVSISRCSGAFFRQ
jgi:hypothetical protein